MKAAVIGIGSNSVRMLIAEIEGEHGTRLIRDRDATRLFAGLDSQGRLQAEAMEHTIATVKRMADIARAEKAQEIQLFATSATRDAANGEEFAALLRRRAGLELIICPGEEEAALSFLGATGGGRSGVIDIGGGSTEIVTGEEDRVATAVSCQMGAVRLFRAIPMHSAGEVSAVIQKAHDILEEALRTHGEPPAPDRWYGTGGTFNSLCSLAQGLPWNLRGHTQGTRLTLPKVEALALQLADMPLNARLALISMQPGRADIIVHGICILIACMRRLRIQELFVSEHGNLDGFLKKSYHLRTLDGIEKNINSGRIYG